MTQKSAKDRLLVRSSYALLAAAAMIGLDGLGASALAGNIYVDNVQLPYSETVNLNGFIDGSSYSDNGQLAGQIVLTVNDGNVASTTQYALPVWCVDIFHDIYLGSSGDRYSQGPLGTDNSDNPSALSSLQISKITALASYGDAQMLSNPTALLSAEVQAAIWTVEYNNGAGNSLDVTSASFTSTDITNLIDAAKGGNAIQLIALDGSQAQVSDTPVPEPVSLGLFAAGLFGIGFVRRRYRKS